MESKQSIQKQNGETTNTYENDIYNYTICSNGYSNIYRKTDDPEKTIAQLMEDLARTTTKLNFLVDTIGVWSQQGVISSALGEQISAWVYGSENNKSKK